jgi:nucleoside-diphosphate-sugar epimerase
MRVFVAGSTGAIGQELLPRLQEAGHAVIALARTPEKGKALAAQGVEVVVADAFDRKGLTASITNTRPDVVIHELTALGGIALDFKKLDEQFALTNRLRTEVVDTMLAAARQAGARRFIVQSFCGWPFAREGGAVKDEEAPLDPDPPASFRKTLAAIRYLEEVVSSETDLDGLALRYGFLYGPGTSIAADGPIVASVRRRQLPLVGGGGGIWSFIHVADAAQATVAAVTQGTAGLYNIVDDEPAPVSAWLPFLADAVGAKPPRRVPAWLARLLIGEGGVSMMTQIRGATNAKAKRELGWQPAYPSWRVGFVEGLG